MIDRLPYEIRDGRFGKTLDLRVPWDPVIAQMAREADVRGLSVGAANPDLSFLRDLPRIESFSYFHNGADTTPIYALSELRDLYLANVSGSRIDFKAFPRLEECVLEWSSGVAGVFEAKGLRRLSIHRLPKAKLPRVAELVRLKDLTLLSCGAASLDAIRGLSRLERLRIASFRRLEDNGFVAKLTNLRDVLVQDCGGFGSLAPFAGLKRLENLGLECVGPVESFRPLAGLTELRTLSLYGDAKTRLVDGDLSPVWALPNLEYLWLAGKGGLSWKSPDARPVLSGH